MSISFVNSFCSSFPICSSFSYLIALVRASSTVLNRNGDSGLLCPVVDFRGKHSVFNHEVWCYVSFFCRCPLSGWRGSFLFLLCWGFLLEMDVGSCQIVFLICGGDHIILHHTGQKIHLSVFVCSIFFSGYSKILFSSLVLSNLIMYMV